MTQININIHKLKQLAKPRYIYLPILMVVLIFVIPYYIQILPNWTPQRSVYNTGDYGHNKLYQSIKNDYSTDVISLFGDLNTNEASGSLLVINAPDVKYTYTEILDLVDWINAGGEVLVLGTTSQTIDLLVNLGIIVNDYNGPVYDFDNNSGMPALPIIKTIDGAKYTAVVPLSVSLGLDEVVLPITSMNSSKTKDCIQYYSCPPTSYIVGFVKTSTVKYYDDFISSPYDHRVLISVLMDNWMFSNKYLNDYPDNINLFRYIVKNQSHRIDRIIFDESHYHYLTLNRVGVLNNLEMMSKNGVLIAIFAVFTLLVPFLFAGMSGLLTTTSNGSDSLGYKLSKRLARAQLNNIPALPLSMEERFLVEHNLQMRTEGKFYFSSVANMLLEYITDMQLSDYISQETIHNLEIMQKRIIVTDEAWKIIIKTNNDIKTALQKQVEAKFGGNSNGFNQS